MPITRTQNPDASFVRRAVSRTYLPTIVDKLTPAGKTDPAADHHQRLAALLPSLLQSLGGQYSANDPPHA